MQKTQDSIRYVPLVLMHELVASKLVMCLVDLNERPECRSFQNMIDFPVVQLLTIHSPSHLHRVQGNWGVARNQIQIQGVSS